MSDILLLLAFALVLLLIGAEIVLLTFGLTQLFGAPFVPTPKKAARDMLTFAGVKPGDVFMDLGSGSGTLLFVAAEEFGVQKAIGFEINPFLVWLTNVYARFSKDGRRIEVQRANFFKHQVGRVDVVATYLWPGTMDRLRSKLKSELRPATMIISRGFTFTDVEPVKVKKGKGSSLYLYRAKDL